MEYSKEFVTSVVLGKDLVPRYSFRYGRYSYIPLHCSIATTDTFAVFLRTRLGLSQLEGFRRHLLEVLQKSNKPKVTSSVELMRLLSRRSWKNVLHIGLLKNCPQLSFDNFNMILQKWILLIISNIEEHHAECPLTDKRINCRLPWNLSRHCISAVIKCHPCIPDEEVTQYSWQTFRLRCSVARLKMLSVCATVEDHRGRHQMHPEVWASAGGRRSSGSAGGAPQRLPVAPSERPQHCPVSIHPAVPAWQDHPRSAQPPAWDVVRKSAGLVSDVFFYSAAASFLI